MGKSSRAGGEDINISDFVQSIQQVESDVNSHKKEMDAVALDQRKIEVKKNKAVLKNQKQDIKLRREFSLKVYNLVRWWLLFCAIIILVSGFELFKLSDTVLTTIIASTSANVLGLFYIVLKYLFPLKTSKLSDETLS